MGLFDFLRGRTEDDPILGGRAQPSGLEAGLARSLQEAGGDPDKLAAELREQFPGAQISVQSSTIDGDDQPELAAQLMHSFFAGGGLPAAAEPDPIAQLERLADLHGRGALTDAEFAAAKAKLLGP